jgi:ribosome-binding factor A
MPVQVGIQKSPANRSNTERTGSSAFAADDVGENVMARGHHRDREKSAAPSQRALRVGELIRHAVSDMLTRGDVHDPVLEGHLITVPEVRMTADLRLATIYVMPLGGRDIEAVLEALDRNKRFLRGEIAHRVNLKFAPEIRFRADERFDEAERIEKLLRTPAVQRDLKRESENE